MASFRTCWSADPCESHACVHMQPWCEVTKLFIKYHPISLVCMNRNSKWLAMYVNKANNDTMHYSYSSIIVCVVTCCFEASLPRDSLCRCHMMASPPPFSWCVCSRSFFFWDIPMGSLTMITLERLELRILRHLHDNAIHKCCCRSRPSGCVLHTLQSEADHEKVSIERVMSYEWIKLP